MASVVLPPATEAELVAAWRLGRLLDMGIPAEVALDHQESDVDLHRLEELIKRGCDPQLALQIVS